MNEPCAATVRSNAVFKTLITRFRQQLWAVMRSAQDRPLGAGRLACRQPTDWLLCVNREKVTGLEAKLRAALQDKNSAQVEKATAERNLKALQGQAGRLTKDLEKKARKGQSSFGAGSRACTPFRLSKLFHAPKNSLRLPTENSHSSC